MVDLGDVARLTFTATDAAGTPGDAGAVTLTVTLPDGTSVTPAVTHVNGTGVYTVDYATTQAGRHVLRWVATGANAGALTDVLNVAAADPGMLLSLAEARSALGGLPNAAVAKDDELRNTVAGATPILEDLIGPVIPRTLTETHDGGGQLVQVLYPPVISVTSVSEAYGAGYVRSLSEQPLGSNTYDAFGYTVDLATGTLQRRIAGQIGPFANGRRNITVTYKAGRSGPLKPNLLLALRRLVRFQWQQEQQGQRPAFGTPEVELAYTPQGFAVPRAVVELCADDLRTAALG